MSCWCSQLFSALFPLLYLHVLYPFCPEHRFYILGYLLPRPWLPPSYGGSAPTLRPICLLQKPLGLFPHPQFCIPGYWHFQTQNHLPVPPFTRGGMIHGDPPSFPQSWDFCIGDFCVIYFFLTLWEYEKNWGLSDEGWGQWLHLLGVLWSLQLACSSPCFQKGSCMILEAFEVAFLIINKEVENSRHYIAVITPACKLLWQQSWGSVLTCSADP